jgi:hypothetical protein
MLEGEVSHKKKHKVDKAWAKIFVEELHKSTSTTFKDVKKCDIDMLFESSLITKTDAATDVIEVIETKVMVTEAVEDSNDYHKGFIKATCKGIEGTLTLEEEQFMATVLTDTYNVLHVELADGGKEISNTHWLGDRRNADGTLANDPNGYGSFWTSWHCRYCEDWDEIECLDDRWAGVFDDATMVEGKQVIDVYESFFNRSGLRKKKKGSKELKQWASMFEAAIVGGPSVFADAKKCKIDILLTTEAPGQETASA